MKSFEKALEFAIKNKGNLLTSKKDYRSNKVCIWKCHNGHIFESTYGNLYYFNRWCSECSGNKKFGNSYNLNDCIEVAKQRNGRCLSFEYVNCSSYMLWECEKGHQWKAKFSNVLNSNNWCRKCSGSLKHTIEDMQIYAKSKNGKCLSTTYKDNKTKLLWECEKGHQWKANYNIISSCNSWCPECKLWKTQRKLFEIICNIVGKEKCHFNYRGFNWLRLPDTNYPMEVDIFIENWHGKNIAVEYHGEQHFRSIEYFGRSESI